MINAQRQPPYFSDIDAVPLPAEHAWTVQEHWAWARILRGEIADMAEFDPALDRAANFTAWLAGRGDKGGFDANELVDVDWEDEEAALADRIRRSAEKQPADGNAGISAASAETREEKRRIERGKSGAARFMELQARRKARSRLPNWPKSEANDKERREWAAERLQMDVELRWELPEAERAAKLLKHWPEHRALSASFMRLILFTHPYATAPARPWIRISHATFPEQLDWMNERIELELNLTGCRFEQDVRWFCLRAARLVDVSNSRFMGELVLAGATIEGVLYLAHCTFLDSLNLDGVRVEGDFYLSKSVLVERVRGDGLSVRNRAFLEELTAGDTISLVDAHFEDKVDLHGVYIGKNLNLSNSSTASSLDLSNATIGGWLSLRQAHVGGGAFFSDAHVDEQLTADGLTVGGLLLLRHMRCLRNAELPGLTVNQDLQLRESIVSGRIDLTGAVIRGELHLAKDTEKPGPSWGSDSLLILRNATVGALAGGVDSFPKSQKRAAAPMELAGLSYTRLGGFGAGSTKAGSLAEASPKQLIAWLEAGHNHKEFTPGPYRQLASALVAAGYAGKANRVLHAMRIHERRCEKNWLRRLALSFSGRAIGFGHRNDYALYWFAVIVLGFAIVGLNWNGPRQVDLSLDGWREFARWIGFSFGNSIPIVQLDKAHETFLAVQFVSGAQADPERFVHEVPIFLAWVFYSQKVLGFAILSFLAAGLTGVATRQKD